MYTWFSLQMLYVSGSRSLCLQPVWAHMCTGVYNFPPGTGRALTIPFFAACEILQGLQSASYSHGNGRNLRFPLQEILKHLLGHREKVNVVQKLTQDALDQKRKSRSLTSKDVFPIQAYSKVYRTLKQSWEQLLGFFVCWVTAQTRLLCEKWALLLLWPCFKRKQLLSLYPPHELQNAYRSALVWRKVLVFGPSWCELCHWGMQQFFIYIHRYEKVARGVWATLKLACQPVGVFQGCNSGFGCGFGSCLRACMQAGAVQQCSPQHFSLQESSAFATESQLFFFNSFICIWKCPKNIRPQSTLSHQRAWNNTPESLETELMLWHHENLHFAKTPRVSVLLQI